MTLRDIYVSYIAHIYIRHPRSYSLCLLSLQIRLSPCRYASHERILIAKVREYDYSSACGVADRLLVLSQEVDIPSAVLLMKRTVPEFKSRNSPYEQYDLQVEREQQSTAQQTA